MNAVGAQVVISGLVQGVGYRYSCYHLARQLGLTGWVKNRPDGSVEVLVEGDRGGIEILIDQLKVGPPSAVVKRVDISWTNFTGKYNDFDVG